MIKIAIVEDELDFQNELKEYLIQFESQSGEQLDTYFYEDGIDIVNEYTCRWDIILMDIKMKYMDGMRAAHKIRELDSGVIIIFITTMAKYAIKGYEVDALDFVLKPIIYEQFSAKMKKAINMVNRKAKKKYLLLPVEDRKEKVSTDEILYVEVRSHNLYVVTERYSYSLRLSMHNIEKELATYHFTRCNNSYLVNLKHVKGIDKDLVCVGRHELPISRPKKQKFLKALSDYLEGGYR